MNKIIFSYLFLSVVNVFAGCKQYTNSLQADVAEIRAKIAGDQALQKDSNLFIQFTQTNLWALGSFVFRGNQSLSPHDPNLIPLIS